MCAKPASPLGEKHIFENQSVKLGLYHKMRFLCGKSWAEGGAGAFRKIGCRLFRISACSMRWYRLSSRLSASTVLYMPLFHVGVISVHCPFSIVHCIGLSVCVRVQKKFPRMSPPQCATVSICVSPGLTLQAMTSSPDLHSMASRIGLLRPERLLAFTAKGFTLGRPLNGPCRKRSSSSTGCTLL